jgi:hypothetical protein
MAAARRLRLMLIGFLVAIATVFAFNYLVNPWGAWRFHLVSARYRRVTNRDERTVTPYLLHTSSPETLLLGSSRVVYGMKIEQGVKDGFQNAALSGSRMPEIAKEVDLALRNPHLKRVIWGVEFYTFDAYADSCAPDTCARLDGDLRLELTDNLLSSDTFVASYRMVLRAMMGKISRAATMPIPWPGPFICGMFAHPEPPTLAGMDAARRFREVGNLPEYRRFDYSARMRQSFVDILGRLRGAHVEVIAFVPPVTQFELEMIRQTGRWPDFQAWKGFVAQHIPYTDFSGYNGIARSDRMFIDAWHMEPAVGATIMRQLLDDAPPDCPDAAIVANSALKVTAQDAGQMQALQERRMEEATATPNVYSTTVAAAIVKRYGHIALPDLSARK